MRHGKVFIDWSQNADHKTTIGVYSLRAKSARPFVSLPVKWEELKAALGKGRADALRWEAKDALARVKKLGDLFAPVPRFVPPMKATAAEKLPEGPEWIYEVKWDGYRAEALKHGGIGRGNRQATQIGISRGRACRGLVEVEARQNPGVRHRRFQSER